MCECFKFNVLEVALDSPGVDSTERTSKGCFAGQNIGQGVVIMQSRVTAAAPFRREYFSNCCNCWNYAPKRSSICKICKMERWCSDDCQQKSSSLHSLVCPYLSNLFSILSTAKRNGTDYLYSDDVVALTHLMLLVIFSDVDDKNYDSMLNLCKLDINSTSIAQSVKEECVNVLKLFELSLKPEEINDVAVTNANARELSKCWEVLLRYQCNGFCFWDSGYNKYGISMCPDASYFNHSCMPNAYKQSHGGVISIQALRDIPPGSEITISYVPLDYDRAARQTILMDYFGFHCACARCIAEEEEEEGDGVACPGEGRDRSNIVEREEVIRFKERVHYECGGVFTVAGSPPPTLGADCDVNSVYLCTVCGLEKTFNLK